MTTKIEENVVVISIGNYSYKSVKLETQMHDEINHPDEHVNVSMMIYSGMIESDFSITIIRRNWKKRKKKQSCNTFVRVCC